MTHFPSQNSTPSPAPTARRHDLDALRAFAMLLGIGLHAGLAYAPIPWIAMNRETSPALGAFVEITHGFRLPLFFLMSGFFSAMLQELKHACLRKRCHNGLGTECDLTCPVNL